MGGLAVWAVIGGYFYFNSGLEEMINNVFTYNLGYIGTLSPSLRLNALIIVLSTLSKSQTIIWGLAGLGLVSLVISKERQFALYIIGWLVASMIGVSASGYFFLHYFQQLIPPLAALSSVGAAAILRANAWHRIPAIIRGSVVFVLIVVQPFIILYPFIAKYSPKEAVSRIYQGNPFAIMPAVGKRVEELTRPDEKLFIFGAEPEVLYYSHRASATKYIFLFPLYAPHKDAFKRQKEAVAEITKSNPAAIVYLPNNLFFMPGSEQYMTNWVNNYALLNFKIDTYIAKDTSGYLTLLRKDKDMALLPPDYTVIGWIFIRKDKASTMAET